MTNGFLDCQPLRDEAANASLLGRDLVPGDVVTIPDLEIRQEEKGVNQKLKFVAKNAPPVSIRFVHGSQTTPYLQDIETTVLNVSNYRTDKGGLRALDPFPKGFGFDPLGHADLDTFKIEIVDPKAGDEVFARLTRLKPKFNPQGVIDSFRALTDPLLSLKIRCRKVNAGKVAYRSRYLRLVTDVQDQFPGRKITTTSPPDFSSPDIQGFLIAGTADGTSSLGGGPTDNDMVEIFDQLIEASYEIPRCPAPAGQKCTVRKALPVGDLPRLQVRMAVHIFRATKLAQFDAAGNEIGIGGATEKSARQRVFNDFRNFYGQACMSPKLVAPFVEFVDPPDENMLVLGQRSGLMNPSQPGTIKLTITKLDKQGTPIGASVLVTIPLAQGSTPLAAGARVKQEVERQQAGVFKADFFSNDRRRRNPNPSCDVLVTASDGSGVRLRATSDDDDALADGLAVARTRLDAMDASDDEQIDMDMRRIARAAPGRDDQADVYVVGKQIRGAAGISLTLEQETPQQFRNPSPLFNISVLEGVTMDSSASAQDVLAHEVGHLLTDGDHIDPKDPHHQTELMSGDPENDSLAVDSAKRISDDPVEVSYEIDGADGRTQLVRVFAVNHFRTRNTGITSPVSRPFVAPNPPIAR
jgi:hypothetical protein